MARELRRRGVTHVVMEASGVYTEPVYHALCELDFTEVIVVNPAHVKALKGHKTDARDCARMAELLECGLLHGSFIPSAEQKEVRDLTRYRMKTVQARTSEIQRLHKALESAGIKLGSVLTDITGVSARLMIDALIDGERRAQVLADLARGTLRQAGKQADLPVALTARFTDHHAMLCRLHGTRSSWPTTRSPGWTGRSRTGPAGGRGSWACSTASRGSGTWCPRPGWPRSARRRTGGSPATTSSPPG